MIYGSFERQLLMLEGVDGNKLTAEYPNGVLDITAPLSTAALPLRVEIKGAKAAAKQMSALIAEPSIEGSGGPGSHPSVSSAV